MPDFIVTTATKKIIQTRKRIRLLAGGMRASKTISVLMCLIDMAQSDKTPTLTSIVSESFPHLRRGAMLDFRTIMQSRNYWDDNRWSETLYTYTFETGSKIEFFSADQPSKLRGPSRDRLFVNELNNISMESWEQLLFRTRLLAFADWNPVGDFEIYNEYGLNDDGDTPSSSDDRVDFLILTYKDNEALEPAIVEDIERKAKLNPGWARVYAEGKRGNNEGKIFKNWKIIDEVPHEARLEVRGLDFGFAADSAVVVDIYRYNGGYIVDELAYRTGMNNPDLAALINNQEQPNVLTIADSAEPKSIAEMQEFGVNIIGVQKKGGKGAISGSDESFTNWAIQHVQNQRMSITKRSVKTIKSYRNFSWQTDKDGRIIKKYDHYLSDGMMAVVYGMTNFAPREADTEVYTSGDFSSAWM